MYRIPYLTALPCQTHSCKRFLVATLQPKNLCARRQLSESMFAPCAHFLATPQKSTQAVAYTRLYSSSSVSIFFFSPMHTRFFYKRCQVQNTAAQLSVDTTRVMYFYDFLFSSTMPNKPLSEVHDRRCIESPKLLFPKVTFLLACRSGAVERFKCVVWIVSRRHTYVDDKRPICVYI